MKSLTYQVLGRGDIIDTNTVEIDDKKEHTFKFLATFAMVPKAKVLIFFIREDGEFVFESVDVTFPAAFQNPVKIDLSTTKAKPGAELDLTITTKPNSFVGLLGVDQSVLLLKKGNDLDQDAIFADLSKFSEREYPYYGGFPGGRPWRPIRRLRRQTTPNEPEFVKVSYFPDFVNTGTVMISNAFQYERHYRK